MNQLILIDPNWEKGAPEIEILLDPYLNLQYPACQTYSKKYALNPLA